MFYCLILESINGNLIPVSRKLLQNVERFKMLKTVHEVYDILIVQNKKKNTCRLITPNCRDAHFLQINDRKWNAAAYQMLLSTIKGSQSQERKDGSI